MVNFILPAELRDSMVKGFSQQLFPPSQGHFVFQVIEALNDLKALKEEKEPVEQELAAKTKK